jgi:hypothetical protein
VDEGAGTADVIVKRTGGSADGVSVTCTPSDGTATGGSDHSGAIQVLSFGAGVMSRSCTVPILEDVLAEGPETLTLTLGDPAGGGTLGTKQTATLTIVDNEAATTLYLAAASFGVGEGGRGIVTVKRSGPAADPVTVDFATSDGTALLSDSDYTAASGTLSFGPNVTSLTFMVPTTADTRDEPDEDVNLTLSNPTGGSVLGTQSTAKLLIVDNDAGGLLRFSTANVNRSETAAIATITVTRTGGTASGVTVDYVVSDGTAQAPADYTSTAGTLTFAAGQTSRTFTVTIVDDALDEPNETVNLTLSNPAGGATLGSPAAATLTLTDNDVAGSMQFSIEVYGVGESDGAVSITVTRSGGTAAGVTVAYATSDGSATAGSDYQALSGTLEFQAGETSKSFVVTITHDALAEANETVLLTLSAPGGGALLGSPAEATLYVVDDD